jgi:hypothetical protein
MRKHLIRRIASAALLLMSSAAALAQTYKPAIEYQSLLNMRYYEASGGFLVEDLQLVFPPANSGNATLVIADQSGQVVDSVPLRFEKMEFPAFGRFRPASGNPGNVSVGKSGNFTMSVVIDGQTITAMPFTLKQETSTDPFNPGTKFLRDGSWRDLAYFAVPPETDANNQIQFNWWLSTRELPPGMKEPKVTIHLLVNGKEIAAGRGPVIPTTVDWYFFSHKELIMPTLPKNRWVTLADLTSQTGEIALVVKANGQPVKTYKTHSTGGQLQRLAQNSLNVEPHATFISPRFVDTSARSNSRYKMFEMYWVRKQ